MQRVTDREAASLYAMERDRIEREQMAVAYEAYLDAQVRKEEDARMASFIQRVIAGLPARRAADRRCEAALAAIATQEGQDKLQGLLNMRTSRA